MQLPEGSTSVNFHAFSIGLPSTDVVIHVKESHIISKILYKKQYIYIYIYLFFKFIFFVFQFFFGPETQLVVSKRFHLTIYRVLHEESESELKNYQILQPYAVF